MILRELLDYFNIKTDLPDYLYDESFNEVFLKGELSKIDNTYEIVIKTRKDITHTMIINPSDDYPVIISSELSNGRTNGIKFSKTEGSLVYI